MPNSKSRWTRRFLPQTHREISLTYRFGFVNETRRPLTCLLRWMSLDSLKIASRVDSLKISTLHFAQNPRFSQLPMIDAIERGRSIKLACRLRPKEIFVTGEKSRRVR